MKRRNFLKCLEALVLTSSCAKPDFVDINLERPDIKFVSIPTGEYEMRVYHPSESSLGVTGDDIIDKVKLDSFNMGATEITNKQYCKFLNQGLKKRDNIKVRNINNNLVVNGSTREYAEENVFLLLKSRFQGIRGEFNESGITYSGGKFKVIKGKEEFPVANVSWSGAKAFAEFYGLDLPTEAQWEYAGTGKNFKAFGTKGGNLNKNNANFGNNIGHPVKVGSYEPNDYGLYDMSGNVEEWCINQLKHGGPTKKSIVIRHPLRGGSWLSYKDSCRIRSRKRFDYRIYVYSGSGETAGIKNNHGFRVVTRVINR